MLMNAAIFHLTCLAALLMLAERAPVIDGSSISVFDIGEDRGPILRNPDPKDKKSGQG